MRHALALTVLLAAAPLVAQNYWFPSDTPTTGNCNAIPFGTASLGGFGNCRMQMRFTAAELWGSTSRDLIHADLWEPYLEAH